MSCERTDVQGLLSLFVPIYYCFQIQFYVIPMLKKKPLQFV